MKQKQTAVILLLATAYVFLRWPLLVNPGITFDLDMYKEWLSKATEFGVSQVYRTSRMDYPPLYAYILLPFGWLYVGLAKCGLGGPVTLTAMVKLPPLLFDLAIGWLLWRGMSLEGKPIVARVIAVTAYLFNPAVLFLTAYWGGPDSIHSFFILASFMTIAYGARLWFRAPKDDKTWITVGVAIAWSLLILAALMKPLGLPYFPLLLVYSFMFYRFRTAVGMATAVVVGLLVFSPFLAQGEAAEVFNRVLSDIGAMPFTSSNAHNFWWLIGAWYYSEAPWIGPLTPTHVGLILFVLSYAALCWKAYRQYKFQGRTLSPSQILAVAAMVSFSFFIFSTHLHEHHLFATVPLLASFALRDRVWRNIFICVSLGVFINCWLHDVPMDHPSWPYTIGGVTSVLHPPYLDRPYFFGELVAIWMSVAFNLIVYSWAMLGMFRGGSKNWLARLSSGIGRDAAERTAAVSDLDDSARQRR